MNCVVEILLYSSEVSDGRRREPSGTWQARTQRLNGFGSHGIWHARAMGKLLNTRGKSIT